MNLPYTYRIGWSKTGVYYYGVRYAKDCHPDDLWVSYFTSSKHVDNYTAKHGAPDILEIRRTFATVNEAQDWENDVIRRGRLVENQSYLNYTNNKAIPVVEFDRAKNFRNSDPTRKRFRDFPKEQQVRIREGSRENAIRQHKEGRANYKKPEDTTNYKTAALMRWSDPQFRLKNSGRKWMTLADQSKMVLPEEQDTLLSQGWSFGRGG